MWLQVTVQERERAFLSAARKRCRNTDAEDTQGAHCAGPRGQSEDARAPPRPVISVVLSNIQFKRVCMFSVSLFDSITVSVF